MDEFLGRKEAISYSCLFEPSDKEIEDAKGRFRKVSETKSSFNLPCNNFGSYYLDIDVIVERFLLPNGRPHGKCEIFFEISGKKAAECTFVDGVLQGKYSAWSKEGDLIMEMDVLDGEPHGTCTFWEFSKFRTRYTFKNGKIFNTETENCDATSLRSRWDSLKCTTKNGQINFVCRNEGMGGSNFIALHFCESDEYVSKRVFSFPFVDIIVNKNISKGTVFTRRFFHDSDPIKTMKEIGSE